MHLLTDSVTAQVADYSVAVRFRVRLHRVGNIAQVIAAARHIRAEPEAFLRNVDQLLRFL